MTSPEISVIMSVYNTERYLEESIKSILNQTFKNFEFLIVDDKSSDGSLNILKRYSLIDKRIQIFENPKNVGLTKNLNFLILKSKGRFIARMDADDISLNDRLEKQREYLSKNQVDLIGSSSIEIDGNGQKIAIKRYPLTHKAVMKKSLKACPILHPTVFAKAKVFKENHYDENYKTCQDLELWFRLLKKGVIIENISEPLLLFRRDNEFLKRRGLKKGILELRIYFKGIWDLKPFSAAYIFPIARLIIRAFPSWALKIIYNSKIRL